MGTKQTEKIFLKLILNALQAYEKGDFSYQLPSDIPGVPREIAATFNRMSQKEADRQAQTNQEVKTILLVDDDVRSLFALRCLLEAHHMKVIHAEDGESCLEILRKSVGVDLILLDIMMPGLDGYEIMSIIRKDMKLSDLPIIVISAKSMGGERQRCLDAGADEYLSKPVNNDQLLSMLNSFFKLP